VPTNRGRYRATDIRGAATIVVMVDEIAAMCWQPFVHALAGWLH
jgi:hypothetical protein